MSLPSTIKRRVYISLPGDIWLSPQQNELKWGIVEEIEKLGYAPEIFLNSKGKRGLASGRAWSAPLAEDVARRCAGAAILGFARWRFAAEDAPVKLPTEYNHYEGALSHTLRLPTLVLVQKDVLRRCVFEPNFGGYIGSFDATANVTWLHTDEFRIPFGYWCEQLEERRDVFLGYCGSSAETAGRIKRFVESLGVRVLDWQTDFIPGRTILEQIDQAATRCVGGIFLFTKDDDLAETRADASIVAAPRDNVVFEAGYFAGMKGKRNVLIVRQAGTKLPADLGGDIYAALPSKDDISPVERTIQGFISSL